MKPSIDATDLEILRLLQADGSISKAEIGRRIGLASSAVFARLRQLEKDRIILGYRVELDYARLDHPLVAFVFVTEGKPSPRGRTLRALTRLRIAEEIHRITGEDCFLLKVLSKDTVDLRAKLDRIDGIPTVSGVRTHVALQSIDGVPPDLAKPRRKNRGA